MFLYFNQQGWESEVVICLQTDKQFLAFHFVMEHNKRELNSIICLYFLMEKYALKVSQELEGVIYL